MVSDFVAIIESIGVLIAASRYGSATPPPPSVLGRGIGWQGISTFLNDIFGSLTAPMRSEMLTIIDPCYKFPMVAYFGVWASSVFSLVVGRTLCFLVKTPSKKKPI